MVGSNKVNNCMRSLICLFALLLAVSLAGCSANEMFVYKPATPVPGVASLPVKIAVLPFRDGTGDFTRRGSFADKNIPLEYNLAKAGWKGRITALTPELWGKAFADDLTSSESFRSARFYYSRSELADEDLVIHGTVEKATVVASGLSPDEFVISFVAVRRADGRKVWSKVVSRKWKVPADYAEGCRGGPQCVADRYQANINRTMQELFAEARLDLFNTLSMNTARGTDSLLPAMGSELSTPLAPGSVEQTIEQILRD